MNHRTWGVFASTLCLLSVSTAWGQTRAPETAPPKAEPTKAPEKDTTSVESKAKAAPVDKPAEKPRSSPPPSASKEAEEATAPSTEEGADADKEATESLVVQDVDPANPYGEVAKEPRVIDTSHSERKAQEEPPVEQIDPSALPFTYHQLHFDLSIGLQVQSAQHNGLEPFINDEVLPEVFFRAGGAFYQHGPLAVAVNAELGTLNRHSTARGDETHLALTRLNVGLEGRYHFHHRVFASLRVAPGAEFASMDLGNEYAPISYSDTSWKFATDASAGMAVRFLGSSDGRERAPRGWFFLEGGAHLAGKHSPTLEANDGAPERPEPVVLEAFSTSGPFLSLGVMGSY